MTSRSEYCFEKEIQGDVASILSFWPLVRDDSEHGPEEALRVLATRSHLERFPRERLDEGVVGELDVLVNRDALKLVGCFSRLTFIEDWLDEAEQLDESWDWIGDEDAADQANLVAIRLFQTLDEFGLACHASRRLLGTEIEDTLRTDLDAIETEVAEGECFLREHPDIFRGAAELVAARLRRFREDLLEHDDRLWETTLKHRVLEEVLEERDAGLTQQEIDELLQIARTVETLPLQREQPAEILPLLRRFREEVESPNRTRRAAAATNGDEPGAEMREQLANRRVPIEGDPAVQVALVPEISKQGQWNGLDISLFGDQESVGQYVKAVLSSASMNGPRVIPLVSGVGTVFFDDDLGTDQVERLENHPARQAGPGAPCSGEVTSGFDDP